MEASGYDARCEGRAEGIFRARRTEWVLTPEPRICVLRSDARPLAGNTGEHAWTHCRVSIFFRGGG